MERRETSYSRETRQAGPILSSPQDENICMSAMKKECDVMCDYTALDRCAASIRFQL